MTVPALTWHTDTGAVDVERTLAYARRAAGTWVESWILSGSTTLGDRATVEQRAEVLDLWGSVLDRDRLMACCWELADVNAAVERGIRPLVVLRGQQTQDDLLDRLAELPGGASVYSHPKLSPATLTADVARIARHRGTLPAGAKISKISLGEITALRLAAGPEFGLWHASARSIEASLVAGATGVDAAALSTLPALLGIPATVADVQAFVDLAALELDTLPTAAERLSRLRQLTPPG